MAEDHVCASSCGFFGSQATLNHLTSSYQTPCVEPVRTVRVEPEFGVHNRCGTCRKRVGLTGFKCRCGVTCCGTHRYAEMHGCTWDYKGAGKVAIARENTLVKAEKLAKI